MDIPRSVTLTLISIALFFGFGIGAWFKLGGGELPFVLDLLFAVCMLTWLPFLIGAIVQRVREAREQRKLGAK